MSEERCVDGVHQNKRTWTQTSERKVQRAPNEQSVHLSRNKDQLNSGVIQHQYYVTTGEFDKDLVRQGSDEFESLADHLKTKGSRANSWTANESLVLVRIVKKVDRSDGGTTGPFWESVETDMVSEKVLPGTKAHTLTVHYYTLVTDLEECLPADQFEI